MSPPADTHYIHALRFAFLNALYDPIVALTTREGQFKQALADGIALQPGQLLLDVGCGTGTLTSLLAQREPQAEIHGLDGDAGMLVRAQRKTQAQGARVTFTQGLSFALPFPDRHFDHVASSLFFHHLLPDAKQRTLAEIHRVLKPGGRLHITDWGMAQDPWMRAAFLVIQCTDGFATTRDHVQGRLPDFVQQAGFKQVRVQDRLRTMLGTLETVRALKP